jgi:uncharacterized protein (DUF608 family)
MEKRKIKIGLETAQRWYGSSDEELKQLAVQTWPEVAEVKLPERWEDLKEIGGYYINNDAMIDKASLSSVITNWDKNIFATKEQAEAALALAQLTQLSAVWCDKYGVYGIYLDYDKRVVSVDIEYMGGFDFILKFETKEKCDRFIVLFEDLILKASALTL